MRTVLISDSEACPQQGTKALMHNRPSNPVERCRYAYFRVSRGSGPLGSPLAEGDSGGAKKLLKKD